MERDWKVVGGDDQGMSLKSNLKKWFSHLPRIVQVYLNEDLNRVRGHRDHVKATVQRD